MSGEPRDSSKVSDPYRRRSDCAWQLNLHNVHTWASYILARTRSVDNRVGIVQVPFRARWSVGSNEPRSDLLWVPHGPCKAHTTDRMSILYGIHTGPHGTCICTAWNSKGYTYGFLKSCGLNENTVGTCKAHVTTLYDTKLMPMSHEAPGQLKGQDRGNPWACRAGPQDFSKTFGSVRAQYSRGWKLSMQSFLRFCARRRPLSSLPGPVHGLYGVNGTYSGLPWFI